MKILPILLFVLLLHTSINAQDNEVPKTDESPSTCKKSETIITDIQDKEPTDNNYIQRIIFEKLNRESVSLPITSVVIDFPGPSIHRHTGEYTIQAHVYREGEAEEECFEVMFVIKDIDECGLEEGHSMRHACASDSVCVNTDGSYECICPLLDGSITQLNSLESRSSWEVALGNGLSTCSGMKSTLGCCDSDAHSESGHLCRSGFHCPSNPCNDATCDKSAECTLSDTPPDYICRCSDGYLGNGRKCTSEDTVPKPKITVKGNPTEETLQNLPNMCGCTLPDLDLCATTTCGKHETCIVGKMSEAECVCAEGYVQHPKHGCIDGRPPKLQLNCDPFKNGTNFLRQGDSYKECSVTIENSNLEELRRSLKLSYKPSMQMLHGCVQNVGEYEVTYTIATPWTIPPFAEVTRKVIVQDVDECSLSEEDKIRLKENDCEILIPKCVPEATCTNTIGSYTCDCPNYTSGDGFLNGTGCVDTHPPTITLHGPSIKLFRTAANAGLTGILSNSPSPSSDKEQRRLRYQDDIQYLISSTNGKEICATKDNPDINICATAVDITPFGTVDLTEKITLGELEQDKDQVEKENEFFWRIGYHVADEAGNKAQAHRSIQVVEVTLSDVEKSNPVSDVKPTCDKCPSCPKCSCPKAKPCPQPAPTSTSVDELNKFILFLHTNIPAYSTKILYTFLAIIAFFILSLWWNKSNEDVPSIQNSNVYYTSPDGRISETPRRHTPAAQTPGTANGFTNIPPPANSIMSPAFSYSPHPQDQDIYER